MFFIDILLAQAITILIDVTKILYCVFKSIVHRLM